jgi:hypothetical protein
MKSQFELVLGKLLSEEKFNEELVANLDEALKKNNFVLSVNETSLLKEILKSGFEVKVGNERITLMCGECCAAGGPCEQR